MRNMIIVGPSRSGKSTLAKRLHEEYMLCVEGEYIVTIDGKEYVLHVGDELFIPKGSLQGGRVKAGTRSIHAFGGQRVKG